MNIVVYSCCPPGVKNWYTDLGILWGTAGDARFCWLCGKCYGKSGPDPVLSAFFEVGKRGGFVNWELSRFVSCAINI